MKNVYENIVFNRPVYQEDSEPQEIEGINYFCEDCEISYTGTEVTDNSFLCPNFGIEGIVD